MMRIALDTNVLVYAEGLNGSEMKRRATNLIQKLSSDNTILPVQVLAELFSVLVKKAGMDAKSAAKSVMGWQDAFPIVDTSAKVLSGAMELASNHKLGLWDSIILASAAEGECRLLLSEDMHQGFTWNGVTVINPFSNSKHKLLGALLE